MFFLPDCPRTLRDDQVQRLFLANRAEMSAVALYCHKVSQKSLHGLTTLCYKAALPGPSPCLKSMTSLCTVFPFSKDQPKYNHPISITGFIGSLGASVAGAQASPIP